MCISNHHLIEPSIMKEIDSIRVDDRYNKNKHNVMDFNLFMSYFIYLIPKLSISYLKGDRLGPTFMAHSYLSIGDCATQYWDFTHGEPYTYYVLIARMFQQVIEINGNKVMDNETSRELFIELANHL